MKSKIALLAFTMALCCLASCQLFSKATGDSGLGSKVDSAEKCVEEFGNALDNFAKLVEDAKAADCHPSNTGIEAQAVGGQEPP